MCASPRLRSPPRFDILPSDPRSAPFREVFALENQTLMAVAVQDRDAQVSELVVVTGRLTIPTAEGDLLYYSAVALEPLESASKAPAAEVAASSCLRKAAALAGLGFWG